MALSVAYGLFYDVSPSQVFEGFAAFAQNYAWLDRVGEDEQDSLVLHEPDNKWTVLELNRRWYWQEDTQRQTPLFISEMLSCSGFLISVHDGDYWEYDLFRSGELLDHFVQENGPESGPPGEGGDADAVVSTFPWLKLEDVAPYLVQMDRNDYGTMWPLADPVRPGDEFGRYEQCALLDFLRMLGVRVSVIDRRVTLAASIAEQFWIKPYDYRH